jgi:tetratricopeptide (TPR) repeat protein
MPMRLWILTLALAVSLGGCAASPYGAPPETDDPWVLIHSARTWLAKGRPRAALPSLKQALSELEKQDPETAYYAHTKASIHNELGRVYEMASKLDWAEESFLRAQETAAGIPERRSLNFEISYNLSTVYERMGEVGRSCSHLQHAATLHRALLLEPADPPYGYGAGGERFLQEVAAPRILQRAERLGCALQE